MKIGVMLPLGGEDGPGGGMPGWKDVRAVADAADQFGLDSVWLADHFFYRAPGRDERTGCTRRGRC